MLPNPEQEGYYSERDIHIWRRFLSVKFAVIIEGTFSLQSIHSSRRVYFDL